MPEDNVTPLHPEQGPIAEVEASGQIEDGWVFVQVGIPNGARLCVEYTNDDAGPDALGLLFNIFPSALEQVLTNMKETE